MYNMQFEKRSGAYMTKISYGSSSYLRYPTVSGSDVTDDFIENIEMCYFKETYEAEWIKQSGGENYISQSYEEEVELKQVSKSGKM